VDSEFSLATLYERVESDHSTYSKYQVPLLDVDVPKLLTPFYIFLEMFDSKQQQLYFMWAASGTI
jgi:hypothetical protein